MGNKCQIEYQKPNLYQSAVVEFEQQLPKFRGKLNFEKQSAYNKIQAAARQFCQFNNIEREYIVIISRLLAYNQHHYFSAFKSIPHDLRSRFLEGLQNDLDVQLMDSLFNHLILGKNRIMNPFFTIQNVGQFSKPLPIQYLQMRPQEILSYQDEGIKMLRQSKVAVMILAAGSNQMNQCSSKLFETLQIQGSPTRLEFMLQKLFNNHNKSTNKFGSTRNSIFSQTNRGSLIIAKQPIIIACNIYNQQKIKNYLSQHGYFGFDQRLIKIVAIKNLPILNEEGKFCLSFEAKTLIYPQGSAKCLELLLNIRSKLRSFLIAQKVEYIHVLSCQDEQDCPADPLFVGLASRLNLNIFAKCQAPINGYNNSMRYVRSSNRLHLLNPKQLQFLNDSRLFKQAPVALNSMIFEMPWLSKLGEDFEIQLALSKRYHPIEFKCNYFDFERNTPLNNQNCYGFEKDIRDYIYASPRANLIQIPTVSKKFNKQ